jgi:hypothetical protein
MSRLLIHVEGQTEEAFVNQVLRGHLTELGYGSVSARILGNARHRSRKRGITPWPSAKKDILNHLKEDPNCFATTMVDFYGLPRSENAAWPGRANPRGTTSQARAAFVEAAMREAIVSEMGGGFNPHRFVPFVLMHEFEALLFSDCQGFSRALARPALQPELQRIRDGFPTPEDINDSPHTAPSKRVTALVEDYQKPVFGPLIALEIGLETIRGECPHFDQWLGTLESLVSSVTP